MSKKNKSGKTAKDAPSKGGRFSPFLIAAAVAGVLAMAAVFFVFHGDALEEKRIPGHLIETRPILPHTGFSGKVATAYRYAAETPEAVDRQFCYCYCKKNSGHKTLLTCFTDDHGAKCGICQNEAIRAHDLHQKGTSMEEIKKDIDAEFGKSHQS